MDTLKIESPATLKKAISSGYFSALLKILVDMGLGHAQVWAHDSVRGYDLKNPKTRIAMDDVRALFEFAGHALDEPNIGLEVGHRFRVNTFTKTGSVLAFSRNLAEAVRINALYQTLTETMGVSAFDSRPDGDFMTWDNGDVDAANYRHCTELVIGAYAMTIHWLSWSFGQGVGSVYLKHAQPKDLKGYERVFQSPIVFDAPENAIKFNKGAALVELPTFNPNTLSLICKRLDVSLARLQRKGLLQKKVILEVERILQKEQRPSEVDVASIIGISARKMRRQLKEESTSYRQIVSNVRRDLCLRHMKSGYGLSQIAQMLGYNDQSAFIRAFRKWYGVSPSQYKAEPISL